ncbi:MAG: S-methyl-5'-thioadenosine phosphorylase [Halobacteriota archaeon]
MDVEMNADVAFIGGSGFYNPDLVEDPTTVAVKTPFGSPSSDIVLGQIGETTCAFLARHGAGHRFSPSRVNYRANIYALKTLGAVNVVAISAVGSLKEDIKPRSIVIPDQIFDRTKLRANTFFDDICVHIGMADPFCGDLSFVLSQAAQRVGCSFKKGGTYVCIEGPQFSTRAESNAYRHMGFDIIGMTAMPEAKLAREAEMCFSMLGTVTDYDVWREDEVTIETVISNVKKNSASTQKIIQEVVAYLPQKDDGCACRHALKDAFVTSLEIVTDETLEKLGPLVGKYLS